jgi:hypothetical protein
MLNTNPGGIDPSTVRPTFGFGGAPQNQGNYLTGKGLPTAKARCKGPLQCNYMIKCAAVAFAGGLQFNPTAAFNNIQNVQSVLAAR